VDRRSRLTWLAAFLCALVMSSGTNSFETPDTRHLPLPTLTVEQRFNALLMVPAAVCFAATIVLLAWAAAVLGIPYRTAVIRVGVR
jgi:hypothetical protein